MPSERSPVFEYIIIGLLILNLAATSYLVLRPSSPVAMADSSATNVDISGAEANALAAVATRLYNTNDTAKFYEEFDSIAKAQFTKEQFVAQLDALYHLMGAISDVAFSSATLAGTESGRDYYYLNFKVRLKGGPFGSGDMKLTAIRRDGHLALVGFYLNGSSQTTR